MSGDRWARVEDLFHHASGLTPDDRNHYLNEHCGADHTLRVEVEALLAAADDEAGFLAPPDRESVDRAVGPTEPDADSGRRIGAWTLEELLGEGGMGRVWKASRAEGGFRQVAALKLLRPGFDSGELLTRFENERQTLARLEHPCIARLIDGGATDEGLPYFVLEYVDGRPIDAHCDDEELSVDERVRLVLDVIDAVAFAHRSLVVHRDLKPANVLVDRRGAARLLDFGIAKFLDQAGDDDLKTLLTAPGAQPMTPAYASPEQLKGAPVTTATDVYALGVLLYRLLTGRLPFDLTGKTPAELERTVCETDPEKPSTAVRHDTGGARRPEPPPVLERRLAGDLDNIVLKAMHKDPARRYRSADALADDLRRYRDGLPVSARGDDVGYRLGKFLRRHRFAAALVTLAVVSASALATVWIRATLRDRDRGIAILRLSDERRLRDLRDDWESLSPARPEHVPRYDAWIERAEALVERVPRQEATLAELRSRGRPLPAPQEAEIGELSTFAEAWHAKRHELGDAERAQLDAALVKSDARLARLRRAASRYRPHEFESDDDRWWHDQLTELLEALDALSEDDPFGATLRAANDARRRAEELPRRSIDAHRDAWDAVRTRLAAKGLVDLPPQVGLVPLGPDPKTGLEEFWHVPSGDRPERRDGRIALTEASGLVLVLVPGGTIRMGAQPTDPAAPHHDLAANESEGPVVEVPLDPYFLSKYEMNQAQWLRATGREPSRYRRSELAPTLLHPVEQVSWDECRAVLFRLGLVLPTEAQWETACRAGTTTPWWTGATPAGLDEAANLADLFARANGSQRWSYEEAERYGLDDGHGVHAPVDRSLANPFGFHDTIGNVWEWCLDSFADYEEIPAAPGTGERTVPGATRRVSRGGGFFNPPSLARASHRHPLEPGFFSHSQGVRPARAVEPATGSESR